MEATQNGGSHEKPKCGGKKHQGEGFCAKPAGWGTNHAGAGKCRLHGGSTKQGVRRGQIELAAKAMATYGSPVDIDPVEALLGEVHRTAGHVAWLQSRIEALTSDELIWGKTETVDKTATEYPGTDTTEQAVPHAWLKLYQQERSHLVSVCKTAIAAGIEARRVKLAEDQGSLMVEVIRGILGDLRLSVEQQALVADVVPRRLRMVA